MRKYIVAVLLLTGCSWFEKKANPKLDPMQRARGTVSNYEALVDDPYTLWHRCDSLTWAGAWNTGVLNPASRVDHAAHEYTIIDGVRVEKTGQIHRHLDPCTGWRGEPSLEIVMGYMHSALTANDCAGMQRMLDYAEANEWVMGTGPLEYTYHIVLAPIAWALHDKLCGVSRISEQSEDALADQWGRLKRQFEKLKHGYRGNVLMYYINLYGRTHGFIRPWHLEAVEYWAGENPDSPIYAALLARYSDDERFAGVYGPALNLFNRVCPHSVLPDPGAEAFHWGGHAPTAALCAYTLSILEGR